jgi:hypothetical protein
VPAAVVFDYKGRDNDAHADQALGFAALHSCRDNGFPCGAPGADGSYTVEHTLPKPSWNNPAKVQPLVRILFSQSLQQKFQAVIRTDPTDACFPPNLPGMRC